MMRREKGSMFIPAIAFLSLVFFTTASGCGLVNNDPVIGGIYAESDNWFTGQSYEIVVEASDLDEDELDYEWTASRGEISGEGSRVTWTSPVQAGAYSIRVKVIDSRGGEASTNLSLHVVANEPPVIVSLEAEDTGCRRSAPVAVDCIAYDHDGDDLVYQWTATGGEVEGEGPYISWVAPDELGIYTITVKVGDTRGGEAEESLEIEVEGG